MSITMTRAAAWTGALALALAGLLAGVAGAAGKPLVTTAQNARLHAKILVNRSGRTLYHLSVERKGHFICIDTTCLSFWHPLLVPKGTKPTGPSRSGRCGGRTARSRSPTRASRCTRSSQDTKRGDTKGEGFKDVGVWHAATVGAAAATSSRPRLESAATARAGDGYAR